MTEHGRFIVIGVGDYRDRHWRPLRHTRTSVGIVRSLVAELQYRQDLPELANGGELQKIVAGLSSWKSTGETLVLYWTGHGVIAGPHHYLVAADSPRRVNGVNALGTDALAEVLAGSAAAEILVLIDCCAAGVAASRMATAIGAVIDESPDPTGRRRFAVIASGQGFEAVEEATFAETLDRVVRGGTPDRRWTEHDSYIRSDELAAALGSAMLERGAGMPDYRAAGAPVPALRNPQHPETYIPDEDVETKQERRRRTENLDEHLVLAARGIEVGETGWHFSGRTAVLTRLVAWLDRAPQGMFVVTGSPGTGKSAVLGRIATLSSPDLRRVAEQEGALTDARPGTVPPLNSVDVAIFCRNKTLDDCIRMIATSLDLEGIENAGDLLRAIPVRGRRSTILLDGLDEAEPAEVVRIANDLLRPLAALPATRVVVGTRPDRAGRTAGGRDGDRPLLRALAADHTIVLDDEPDTDDDLAQYTSRRLRSAPALENQPELVADLTDAIVPASAGVFLFARIATHAVVRRPEPGLLTPESVATLVQQGLEAVLAADLARYAEPDKVFDLLRPLSWAQGAGLPRRDIWVALANALADGSVRYHDDDLTWLLDSAGFYLVESGEFGQTVYRLYHQALVDHFRARSPHDAQTRITDALLDTLGPPSNRRWAAANPYIVHYLATHALPGGRLRSLLADVDFLVYSEPARTVAAVLALSDAFERPWSRLYLRAVDRLDGVDPETRSFVLQETAFRDEPELRDRFTNRSSTAEVVAGSAQPTSFHWNLSGHAGPLTALAVLPWPNGSVRLASGGGDQSIRLWNPDTGQTEIVLLDDTVVTAMAALSGARGPTLLASAGQDSNITLWDPTSGERRYVLSAHRPAVRSLASFRDDAGNAILLSGGDDRRIHAWTPGEDRPVRTLDGKHLGAVTALTSYRNRAGRQIVASSGPECTIRLWDLATEEELTVLAGHTGEVTALVMTGTANMPLLASTGLDNTIRIWNTLDNRCRHVLVSANTSALNLAAVTLPGGKRVLAASGNGARIDLWDPERGYLLGVLVGDKTKSTSLDVSAARTKPGQVSTGMAQWVLHAGATSPVHALSTFPSSNGQTMIASAGWDSRVRLWNLAEGQWRTEGEILEHDLCALAALPAENLVVIGDRNGAVEVRNAETGDIKRSLQADAGSVAAVAAISDRDRVLVAVKHGPISLYDLADGTSKQIHETGLSTGLTLVAVSETRTLLLCHGRAPFWATGTVLAVWDISTIPTRLSTVPAGARYGCASTNPDLFICILRVDGRWYLDSWNHVTGEQLRLIDLQGDLQMLAVLAPQASAGDQELICGLGHDKLKIDVWWHTSGEAGRRNTLFGHRAEITEIVRMQTSLGPDVLASVANDQTLRIWNPAAGKPLLKTVPLPGLCTKLVAGALDELYVAIDDYWLRLRI